MKRKVPIGLPVTLEDESDSLTNPRPVEVAGGFPVIIPSFEKAETIQSLPDFVLWAKDPRWLKVYKTFVKACEEYYNNLSQ